MANIILSTINARYIHSSLGLRYLLANMGEMQSETTIKEFVINSRPIDIVEALLRENPSIVGFSVYIWNIEPLTQVVSLLKRIRPDVIIILGGPEISFETEQQSISRDADYIICGAADIEFSQLCRRLLSAANNIGVVQTTRAVPTIITASTPDPGAIHFPYIYYNDEDIAHRIIYVEASRGCPYKCEFCLSALDKTAVPFDLDVFLLAMQDLYDRGARRFKFVDRTFNLKVDNSIRILKFFLERMSNDLFLHFELIPDHLPERLKALVKQFPPGSLQFEIGVQTFNPQVQITIQRKQDNQKTEANLRWLREHTHAHLHTDLIIGLPGENLESIAAGFDKLVGLNPHEIQVGILKRLRGSPIIRHTEMYNMVYNPHPPYNILQTSEIDFDTMQRLSRFARYWDLIANSGRFKNTVKLILQDNPFKNFLQLSDWLFNETGQTHKIALERLFELLFKGISTIFSEKQSMVQQALYQDFISSGMKSRPSFADSTLTVPDTNTGKHENKISIPKRQARHLN